MRRDRLAWILIDVGNSAFATTILAALFPVYLPSLLPPEGVTLSFLGPSWQTSAISLWGYTVSASLLITLILSPFLGAWADESGHRKKIFAFSSALGITATASLAYFDTWQSALICFVFANIGFSASNVFYNALLPCVAPEKEWDSLSLKGFAWGYVGGGILLAINLATILKFEWFGLPNKKAGIACSFIAVSVWWAAFTIPALIWIKEEVKAKIIDPLPGAQRQIHIFYSTLKSVIRNPNLLLFMVSFACYNDGIQTVISMASIFGKEILALNEDTLIGTLLIIQFLGLPFTLLMTFASKYFGAKRTLMASLAFWLVIVGYAFFMNSAQDFWVLGLMVSVVLGVSQALPRSIFASLIPRGRQAEYFSFFALSGKMTSILGPTIFAVVKDFSGDARLSILALGFLFLVGIGGLNFVSIDRAKTAR